MSSAAGVLWIKSAKVTSSSFAKKTSKASANTFFKKQSGIKAQREGAS
jgi:hypothetical protein